MIQPYVMRALEIIDERLEPIVSNLHTKHLALQPGLLTRRRATRARLNLLRG